MKHIAKALAKTLAKTGRNGDTELLHVTKPELAALNRLSQTAGLGSLPRNPATGLPEASLLGTILPIVGAVVGGAISGGTGTGGGYAAGAAIGGALGGYAGSRIDNTNPYLGTILGGVGGYMGGSAMEGAVAAETAPAAAGAEAAGAQAVAPTTAAAGTTTVTPAATATGTQAAAAAPQAGIAGLDTAATAAPTASGSYDTFMQQMNSQAGMSAAPAATTPATAAAPNGVLSWAGKHPVETYMLGTAGVRALSKPSTGEAPEENYTPVGAVHNQRQYTGYQDSTSGEADYFTGNSLYNYTQDPEEEGYADGGAVTPKYTMPGAQTPVPQQLNTPNAVQYGAGNNAQMSAAPDLRAPAPAAQTVPMPNGESFSLPPPTAVGWYEQAALANPNYQAYLEEQKAKADDKARLDRQLRPSMHGGSADAEPIEGPAPLKVNDISVYATGGLASLNPAMIRGAGDGMSDSVPAVIANGKRSEPIRVANEEYIVPADVVAHLGNGSSAAGAKHLDKAMAKIRKARTGNSKQGKKINPEKFI